MNVMVRSDGSIYTALHSYGLPLPDMSALHRRIHFKRINYDPRAIKAFSSRHMTQVEVQMTYWFNLRYVLYD